MDVIAAIATGASPTAIGIVRVSGSAPPTAGPSPPRTDG